MFATLRKIIYRWMTPVNFRDLTRTLPVSDVFGAERGTPVDRYYIENFFRKNSDLIGGQILEVGDNRYSRKFSDGKAISFDVLHYMPGSEDVTLIGDLSNTLTLPANSFDCFICAHTFQYIFEIDKAVKGAYYLLKPGGVLLATVPGISQISRYDAERYGEYWRFTTYSMEKLFKPVFRGGVEIESFGNVLSSIAFLQGIAQEDLPDLSLLDKVDRDYQLIITIIARKETT